MLTKFLKKDKAHVERQNQLYRMLFLQVSSLIVMRTKEISFKQVQFVLDFLESEMDYSDPIEAAVFVVDGMEVLQKHTTYLGFYSNTRIFLELDRSLKKQAIIKMVMFQFLENGNERLSYNFIGHISEDIGIGNIFFFNYCAKAHKLLQNFKPKHPEDRYKKAYEIISDGLLRSNLSMSY